MQIGQPVPEALAAMPPGPELAAVLDALTPELVPNDDIGEVLIARSRQLAHEQAGMLALLAEVVCRRPFAGPGQVRRGDTPAPYAADEVRAALAWTRRSAESETDFAWALVHRLPLVFAALDAGEIDRGRAWVFVHHISDLTAAQIRVICAALLPVAGRLTTGQLGERLRRMVLELDPDHYQRRYRRSVRERRVTCYLDADGTATITASGLPAEEAAAAIERVDSLARADRRHGHPGTLDQIRADLILGLLDGSLHTLTRDQIIDALISRYTDLDDAVTSDIATQADPVAHRPSPEDQRVGVEIRVPLPTLLGHDDRAGELPGLGPVTADTARRTVARQRRSPWRWVVVDADGHLVSEGITRRRPAGMARTGPRGGVVELLIRETDLADLAADPDACGGWADVVTDIAGQHHDRDPAAHLRDLDSDPGRRFPTAAQRRRVEVRDRTCTFPGCRTSAHRSDVDHTVDHHRGGPTATDDLSPLCRHDHMLKTEGGWELRQPEPGRFVWRSPLGREYPVAPEPILPPVIDRTAREPDPSLDEPADDTDHPFELPAGDRAPPPHHPHSDITLEPHGGDEPPGRGRNPPAGGEPDDDPAPF